MVDAWSRVEDDEVTSATISPNTIVAKPKLTIPQQNTPQISSAFDRIENEDGSISSSISVSTREDTTGIIKSDPVSSIQSAMAFGDEGKTEEELLASIKMKQDAFNDAGDEAYDIFPLGIVYSPEEQKIIDRMGGPTEIDWSVVDDEYELPTPSDQAKAYMRELMGGSLPTDAPQIGLTTIANDPNSRLFKTMNEYAEMSGSFSEAAKAAGKTKEQYFAEDVFPNMEDGMMKSFFQYAASWGLGEEAFGTMIGLGKTFDYTGAAYTDGVEIFFENLQKNAPNFYDGFVSTMTGAKMSPKTAAESFARETGAFLEFSETLGVVLPVGAFTNVSGLTRKEVRAVNNAIKEDTKKFLTTDALIAAEKTTKAAKRTAAKEAAAAHANLQERMIMEFEQELGARSKLDINQVIDESKLISQSKDGVLVLDPVKYRQAGTSLLEEQGFNSKGQLLDLADAGLETIGLGPKKGDIPEFLLDESGSITVPIIKAENLDSFVAVAADLLERKGVKYDPAGGKRLVDVIFELSVDEKVIPEGELLELLNKYDLSFEEYATMMVGSASEAGKVLNKFSQISRRVKPKSELDALKEAKMLDMQNGFAKTFRKIENIRRGGLVSQLATAARNLSSAGVRAPLEGLQNVLDTAMYNYDKDGLVSGLKSLGDVKGNWSDSFRHLKYTFDPKNYNAMKEYTDFILDRPELANQYDRMFNQINEVRRSTDIGTDTILGKSLDFAEKGVDIINAPNRWQEYLIRRGTFTAELERLVKREYDLDLIDVINQGKLPDLLNDSPELIGANKRPFKELVDDSVGKALDITYAKQPEVPVFRELTSFITRNGLTTVAPFPRFMFNSMELAGEYSAGAFFPVINRSIGAVTGNKRTFTTADRRMVSRNIIGATVILPSAMMYRNSEDAPADYKMLRADDGTLLDTSAQSPILRQSLWIAEWLKRNEDGTAQKWMREQGYKEGMEAFVGTNIRTGTGGVIFQDVAKIFTDADAMGTERAQEYFGEAFGEYASTFLTPINQLIETQRAFEFRTDEYVDTRSEPTFEEQPFLRGLTAPFKRKGYTTLFTPSKEAEAPLRETIFQEGDSEARVMPLLKVFTGLSLKEDVSETGKFLMELGFADYKIRSRSISPGFQRYETKVLREILPSVVEVVQSENVVNTFKKMAETNRPEGMSVDAFVRIQQTNMITKELEKYKSQIDEIIVAEPGSATDLARSNLTTKDGKPIDVELTAYLKAQQQFRRMKPDTRAAAYTALPYLIERFGDSVGLTEEEREPSMANIKHLQMMIDFGKL